MSPFIFVTVRNTVSSHFRYNRVNVLNAPPWIIQIKYGSVLLIDILFSLLLLPEKVVL